MSDDFSAPTEGLVRSMPFEVVRAEDDGDGFTLEGYAAVFNSPTRINSWEGNFDERIAPGAFKKTLREKTPVLMFNHGQHPFIGDMPIGKITSAKEDERGVHIVARLFDNDLIKPVRDAIAGGAIDGMSFRFSVVRESWDSSGEVPSRTLREVKAPELGPVVFPAYSDTSVGVRAADMANAIAADPALREQIARALLLGTPEAAVRKDTAEVAATPSEPTQVTPGTPQHIRRARAAHIRGV